MRYINKQLHDKSCGPIAIMNCLKWLGTKINYREHLDIFRALYWKPQAEGSKHEELDAVLDFFDIKYEKKSQVTVRDIEKVLNEGNSVLLSYTWYSITHKDQGCHVEFIDRCTSKYLKSKNTYISGEKMGRTKKQYRYFFKRGKREPISYYGDRPVLWVISPQE